MYPASKLLSSVATCVAAITILLHSNSLVHAHPTGEHDAHHEESNFTADKVEANAALKTRIALWQGRLSEKGKRRSALEHLGWLFIEEARRESDDHIYNSAVACANLLAEEYPESALDALLMHGHVRLQRHDFSGAELAARELVQRRGNAFDYALLGDALLEIGRIGAAADAFQKTIDLRPGFTAYVRAAELRWMKGDVEGSQEMMLHAIRSGSMREPESLAWVHSRFSHFLLLSGHSEEALVAANRALELAPQYAPGLRARGLALMAAGNYTAAEEPLTLAAQSVEEPGYLWPLWECLSALERGEATRVLKEKLTATGSKRDPRTYALFLATMGEQIPTAVILARREVEVRKDAYTLDALAWAIQSADSPDAGILKEARALSERALAVGVKDPRVLFHAVVIDSRTGHYESARRRLETIGPLKTALLPSEQRILEDTISRIASVAGFPSEEPAEH